MRFDYLPFLVMVISIAVVVAWGASWFYPEIEKPIGVVERIMSYDKEFLNKGNCLVVIKNVTRNIEYCPSDIYEGCYLVEDGYGWKRCKE